MRHTCGHPGASKAWKWAALAAIGGRGWGSGWSGDGGFGGFGPRGGRGAGGPRGGRRMFDRAGLRLVLLSLIDEQPRHGYDCIRAIEERSGGHYAPSPGIVYPALQMLADEDLIAEQESEDQRRRFSITAAGEALLRQEAAAVEAALARLTEMGERSERQRAPSVERAAANLAMALSQRMRGKRDDDLPHRIAAILDEAAQKIERL